MRHGYLILDHDVPLYLALSEEVAERTVIEERSRIEGTIRRGSAGNDSEIQNRIAEHYVHWTRVPFVR